MAIVLLAYMLYNQYDGSGGHCFVFASNLQTSVKPEFKYHYNHGHNHGHVVGPFQLLPRNFVPPSGPSHGHNTLPPS